MADKPKPQQTSSRKRRPCQARYVLSNRRQENKKRALRKAIKRSKGLDTQARRLLEEMGG